MALSEERIQFLRKDFERGFINFCGIKAWEIKEGYFESSTEIEPHHRQQDGFIHAGLIATMADHTAGYAAFTLVPEDHQILTIEFKINFLRPAVGERLVCKSKIIRSGTHILVGESLVLDLQGSAEKEVAKAMVTLAAVPAAKLRKEKT